MRLFCSSVYLYFLRGKYRFFLQKNVVMGKKLYLCMDNPNKRKL